jgi:hypothetical protein
LFAICCSTIESLLSNSESVAKGEEDEKTEPNEDVVDSVVPTPDIPPPPPLPSIESSTDTLVPTEMVNNIISREESPKLHQVVGLMINFGIFIITLMVKVDQSSSECHVCASSRKFLLESSVLELSSSNNNGALPNGHTRTSSHYSTPTSYPPTPGNIFDS